MAAGVTTDQPGGDAQPSPEAAPYDRVGTYRLVQQLGEGGMGVVHLAIDRAGRAVAIKVLRDHVAHDADARARLAREVETLARVQDPRVAAVLDADTVGNRPYIVTRYVPGPPLDKVVAEKGPLDTDGLLRLGRGLLGALTSIHAAGVVHRDLKPANVLLVDGDPVVIDFGIAHVADDIRLTMTGLVMGTPGYLSPEIVEGAPVTEATDWWGWAATLAFAAKGSAPFGRGPMDVVLDRVRRGEADLSGVDERLLPLLYAALSPDASRRPHAWQILAALDRFAAGGDATVVVPLDQDAQAEAEPVPITSPVPRTRPLGTARPSTVGAWPDPLPSDEAGPAGWWPPPAAAPVPSPAPYAAPSAGPGAGRGAGVPTPDPAWGWPETAVEPYPEAAAGWSPAAAAMPVPPSRMDPRIGMEPRTWTLGAVGVALTGAAAVWPVITGAVLVLLVWAARVTDRSTTTLVMRRLERGPRRSDLPVVVALGPLHLLTALVGTLLGLLLPAVVAAAAAFAAAMGVAALTGTAPAVNRSLPLSAGMLVGLVMAWWGPGGVSLRRGARSIVRRVSPGELTREILATALVLVGAGLALWAWLRHGNPDWRPLAQVPLPGYLRSLGS